MNFKFIKSEDNINVLINTEGIESDFEYTKMINLLYTAKTIEPSIFDGDFLTEEKDNINMFVTEMVEKIAPKEDVAE